MSDSLVTRANSLLDHLAQPTIDRWSEARSSYQVLAVLGLFAGYLLAACLTVVAGLELWPLAFMILLACLTFLGQGMLYWELLGYERLAMLEQVPVILIVVSTFAALIGRSVLQYLDVFVLGLAATLAIGRIGCYMAGCCHGKPSQLGVCYDREHAERGLPEYYFGIRLFPIQLLEAAVILTVLVVGIGLHLGHMQPGAVVTWVVTSYGAARFFIEFGRGDSHRPYILGLSLNQWICFAGVWMVVLLYAQWNFAIAPVVRLAGISVAAGALYKHLRDWRRGHRPLLHPQHVAEVYRKLTRMKLKAMRMHGQVVTDQTEAGVVLGLSLTRKRENHRAAVHYSIAAPNWEFGAGQATEMARLIAELQRYKGPLTLTDSGNGHFHMCLEATSWTVG